MEWQDQPVQEDIATAEVAAETRRGRLAGKAAVITGGSSGIGHAAAVAFVREGARVLITGREAATLRSAVAALRDGRARGTATCLRWRRT